MRWERTTLGAQFRLGLGLCQLAPLLPYNLRQETIGCGVKPEQMARLFVVTLSASLALLHYCIDQEPPEQEWHDRTHPNVVPESAEQPCDQLLEARAGEHHKYCPGPN